MKIFWFIYMIILGIVFGMEVGKVIVWRIYFNAECKRIDRAWERLDQKINNLFKN